MIKKLVLLIITLLISYTVTCQNVTTNKDSLIPIPKFWLREIVKDLEKKDNLEKKIEIYITNDSLYKIKSHFQDSIIKTYEKNESHYTTQVNAYKVSDTLQKTLITEYKNKAKEFKKERNILGGSTLLLIILIIL